MFELQLVMTGAAEAAGALLCDGDGGVVSVGIYADDCGLNSHERYRSTSVLDVFDRGAGSGKRSRPLTSETAVL
jgi:hypothetical protein